MDCLPSEKSATIYFVYFRPICNASNRLIKPVVTRFLKADVKQDQGTLVEKQEYTKQYEQRLQTR